jgi:hypothetical protein
MLASLRRNAKGRAAQKPNSAETKEPACNKPDANASATKLSAEHRTANRRHKYAKDAQKIE